MNWDYLSTEVVFHRQTSFCIEWCCGCCNPSMSSDPDSKLPFSSPHSPASAPWPTPQIRWWHRPCACYQVFSSYILYACVIVHYFYKIYNGCVLSNISIYPEIFWLIFNVWCSKCGSSWMVVFYWGRQILVWQPYYHAEEISLSWCQCLLLNLVLLHVQQT